MGLFYKHLPLARPEILCSFSIFPHFLFKCFFISIFFCCEKKLFKIKRAQTFAGVIIVCLCGNRSFILVIF